MSFHLIEHPIEATCSRGPWPVRATSVIASFAERYLSTVLFEGLGG